MTVILSSKVARSMGNRLLKDAARAADGGHCAARALAKDPRYASRGVDLEKQIMLVNALYRRHGIALIEKVPTEWLPIRDSHGRVVSAKVTRPAAVDFLGVYRGLAIAFDAKGTKEARVRWDRVEEHQAGWLKDWARVGGLGFVLVAFIGAGVGEQWWLCPWEWWWHGLNLWQQDEGAASFKVEELPAEWRVPEQGGRVPMDYLATLDKVRGTCGKEADYGQA